MRDDLQLCYECCRPTAGRCVAQLPPLLSPPSERERGREREKFSFLGSHGSLFARRWHVRIRVQRRCVWGTAAFRRTEGSPRKVSPSMAEKNKIGPPVAGSRKTASGGFPAGNSLETHRGEPVSNGKCAVTDTAKRFQNETICESPTGENTGSESASKAIPRRSSLIKVGHHHHRRRRGHWEKT